MLRVLAHAWTSAGGHMINYICLTVCLSPPSLVALIVCLAPPSLAANIYGLFYAFLQARVLAMYNLLMRGHLQGGTG